MTKRIETVTWGDILFFILAGFAFGIWMGNFWAGWFAFLFMLWFDTVFFAPKIVVNNTPTTVVHGVESMKQEVDPSKVVPL